MAQKLYELTCLLSPDFNEEQLLVFARGLEAKIENGKIIKSEIPKRIGLSYSIKKQNMAFLTSTVFETEAEKIEELKKTLKKEEKILRFLLVTRKRIEETPSVSLPCKAEESIPSADDIKTAPISQEETAAEKPKKEEKVKKEKGGVKEKTEKKVAARKKIGEREAKSDLKQIEEDLDKILGVPDDDEQKAKSK